MTTPALVSTLTLTLHPLVEWMPPADESALRAMEASITDLGILEPLKVCKGRVVDGRLKLRAAAHLGLDQVPCVEIAEEDVASVAMHSLLARKHYSKSALAYLGYPMAVPAMEAARARRLRNLVQNGQKSAQVPQNTESARNALSGELGRALPKTAEEIAAQLGIERRLFFYAQGVHRTFAEKPELREKYEARILSGELSLGEVIQACNGDIAAADGKTVPFRDPADLFVRAWDDVSKRLDYWTKLDAKARHSALEKITETLAAMPPDLRDGIAAALKKAATAAPLEVVK